MGTLNDFLRGCIGVGMLGLGALLELGHRWRVRRFLAIQRRLRRRYGIRSSAPILPHGDKLVALIEQAAAPRRGPYDYAVTSGSTSHPKRILYPRSRIRSVKWTFSEVYLRMAYGLSIRRKSLYVFSSFCAEGDSLTALLLSERRPPPYWSTLQAPYRAHADPALGELVERYTPAAIRLFVLTLSNPGVLYSTNPSTIALFLDELVHDWPSCSRLVRDFHHRRSDLPAAVSALARRLASRGSEARIARIAESASPLGLGDCAPGVETYICWTGGYVKPFLERIESYLPRARYRLIPMYSMSTETVETVSSFRAGRAHFLPLARGVLYEFVEEGAFDEPENLRTVSELQVGKTYSMVVSDPFGLRRYQTEDVFVCKELVAGLPDLRFLRRRGLTYSFTGEKLTGEQWLTVFCTVRREFTELLSESFMAAFPSQPKDEPRPHYKIVIVDRRFESAPSDSALAHRCHTLLGEINREYRGKVESGRLAPTRVVRLPLEEFVALVGGERQRVSWEAQFKFLPLYPRSWESARSMQSERNCRSAAVSRDD